jgi:hypothetical protein
MGQTLLGAGMQILDHLHINNVPTNVSLSKLSLRLSPTLVVSQPNQATIPPPVPVLYSPAVYNAIPLYSRQGLASPLPHFSRTRFNDRKSQPIVKARALGQSLISFAFFLFSLDRQVREEPTLKREHKATDLPMRAGR